MSRRLNWAALLGAAAVLATLASVSTAGDTKKIRVVIIDGQNNHNWKATTPVMKKELEDTGRFAVDVATSPPLPNIDAPRPPSKPKDGNNEKAAAKYEADLANYKRALAIHNDALPRLKADRDAAEKAYDAWRVDFDKYDVVLSNFNGTDRTKGNWPKAINVALEERLKSGQIGLVIVHAANNAFGGWKEYNQMIGMGWRGANYGARLYVDADGKAIKLPKGKDLDSSHRYTGKFTITIRDDSHPITKGMPREWMHNNDELYDNMRGPVENVHLLATAYSKGTQKNEPMIWTVSYGKGRVFHTPMGHDVNGMRCVGFMATLQRGTEWAATGTVTLPLPANFPTDKKVSTIK